MEKKIQVEAELLGNKAANLKELERICNKITKQIKFNVQVPAILPLRHTVVWDHLKEHAPEWEGLWEAFKKIQSIEKEGLSAEGIEILEKLQVLILETFEEHPIPDPIIEVYLDTVKKQDAKASLMVRSTGREDTVDLANPGGNESVPSALNPTAISNAIGVVVASYFSEKSLKQRLLGKEGIAGILKEDPFMPVLLQRMIGEPLGGLTEADANKIPISGVLYTSEWDTRIQLAPGHGTLIVNSKAPFDTFSVTQNNVVHSAIYHKEKRLVPILQKKEDKTKTILELQPNPKALRDKASIPDLVAIKIAQMGRLIEEHYGRPMDVEFVYEPHPTDPEKSTIYLVQARPIPEGDLKLVIPSSIPPEKVAELKGKVEKVSTTVITPAGSAAHVITHSSQILICDNIDTALRQYLAQIPSPVKAVIIQETAPATSHEAAQFNSKAIPVLQVKNLQIVKSWIEKEKPVLIVDPQRAQILDYSKYSTNHSQAEKELYESGILKKGLFKFPAAQATVSPLFPTLPEGIKSKILKMAKEKTKGRTKEIDKTQKYQKPERLSETRIGDLIVQANSLNISIEEREAAFNQLMLFLFPLLLKEPTEIVTAQQDKKNTYQTLLEQLKLVEAAKAGDENKKAHQALQYILTFFYKFASSEKAGIAVSPHQKLFQHAMITGAEIYKSLETFSGLKVDDPDIKKNTENRQKELLVLVSYLEGLVTDPGNKNLFSDSVWQIAQESKARQKASKMEGFEKLDAEQQNYFIQMMKLQKVSLNKRLAKEWTAFALWCCKGKANTQRLSYLIRFNIINGIESDWLNQSFGRHYKAITEEKLKTMSDVVIAAAPNLKNREILARVEKEALQTAKELNNAELDKKRSVLQSWEGKIGEWEDPNAFDKLWKGYEEELIPLIEQLNISKNQQPLTQKAILKMVQDLTEIMDRTIKALKGSPNYRDIPEKQVERFAKLLTPYHALMGKWVGEIPEKQFIEWSQAITEERPEYNHRKKMLDEISKAFSALADPKNPKSKDPNQLKPSGSFSVASARIGTRASFRKQFSRQPVTLEDIFTLIHQNILKSTILLGQTENSLALFELPEDIQPLIQAISTIGIPWETKKGKEILKPELLSVEHKYPIIQIEYNLPMRDHSARFMIEYNQDTHQTTIHTKLFGDNWRSRMDTIASLANLEGRFLGTGEMQTARFNPKSLSLEFSWKLEQNQIEKYANLVKLRLNEYTRMTFRPLDEKAMPSLFNSAFLNGDIELINILISKGIPRKLQRTGIEHALKTPKLLSSLLAHNSTLKPIFEESVREYFINNRNDRQFIIKDLLSDTTHRKFFLELNILNDISEQEWIDVLKDDTTKTIIEDKGVQDQLMILTKNKLNSGSFEKMMQSSALTPQEPKKTIEETNIVFAQYQSKIEDAIVKKDIEFIKKIIAEGMEPHSIGIMYILERPELLKALLADPKLKLPFEGSVREFFKNNHHYGRSMIRVFMSDTTGCKLFLDLQILNYMSEQEWVDILKYDTTKTIIKDKNAQEQLMKLISYNLNLGMRETTTFVSNLMEEPILEEIVSNTLKLFLEKNPEKGRAMLRNVLDYDFLYKGENNDKDKILYLLIENGCSLTLLDRWGWEKIAKFTTLYDWIKKSQYFDVSGDGYRFFATHEFKTLLILLDKKRTPEDINDILKNVWSDLKKEQWSELLNHSKFRFPPYDTMLKKEDNNANYADSIMGKLMAMNDEALIKKAIEKGYDINALLDMLVPQLAQDKEPSPLAEPLVIWITAQDQWKFDGQIHFRLIRNANNSDLLTNLFKKGYIPSPLDIPHHSDYLQFLQNDFEAILKLLENKLNVNTILKKIWGDLNEKQWSKLLNHDKFKFPPYKQMFDQETQYNYGDSIMNNLMVAQDESLVKKAIERGYDINVCFDRIFHNFERYKELLPSEESLSEWITEQDQWKFQEKYRSFIESSKSPILLANFFKKGYIPESNKPAYNAYQDFLKEKSGEPLIFSKAKTPEQKPTSSTSQNEDHLKNPKKTS